MTPRHRRRLGVLFLGVALLLPTLGATAASGSPIDDKRAEASRLAAKIDALGNRLSVLDEQYNAARLRLDKIDAQVVVAQAKASATAERYQAMRAKARDRAVAAYMSGGSLSRAASIIGAHSSDDLFLRNQYLATAIGDDRETIDLLKAAREDLGVQQANLDKDRAAARTATSQVRSSRDEAAKAMSDQQALLSSVKGELDSLVRQEEARRAAEAARRAQAELAARAARARGSRSRAVFDAPPGTDAPPPSAGAGAAVDFARAQLGKPYQWGGAGPDSYDCSGLTMRAWEQGGVSLSHSAAAQYDETTHIPLSNLQPGDLLFFGSDIHHEGIYVGGGQMIEAPHSGAYVRYASIYRSDLVGAGRPG